MNNFIELTESECLDINGDGLLSGAAGGILGFIAAAVIVPVKIAVSGNDSGAAQILLTCVVGGAWAGAGFPLP